jgi:hypothetical protein
MTTPETTPKIDTNQGKTTVKNPFGFLRIASILLGIVAGVLFIAPFSQNNITVPMIFNTTQWYVWVLIVLTAVLFFLSVKENKLPPNALSTK